LNPNLTTCVLSAALATNNSDYFDQITNIIYREVTTTQQDYILSALGAVYTSDTLLTQAISFVLSDAVRNNVKIRGLYSCRRCKGRFNMWTALSGNNGAAWDNLATTFASGFAMSDLTAVFETFASDTMLNYVTQFYNTAGRTNSGNVRVVNQTLESVNSRTMWLDQNRGQVKEFLIAIGDYPSNNNPSGGDSDDDDDWYSTWWFILILVVVSLLLISLTFYGLYRYRLKRRNEGYLEIDEKRNIRD